MGETQEQRSRRQSLTASAALPGLGELADELEALTREVFEKRVPYEPNVGADVMALSFVTKQNEHLRSIRTLLSVGAHRDAQLIARTMIEGLGRLVWAFNNVPERTELWFWFGAIVDWRQTQKNEESGIPVPHLERTELKAYVEQHGPNYYRKGVRQKLQASKDAGDAFKLPDDPWANDWTAVSLESMFAEIQATFLYDGIYRDTSEWVHWGPRSILRAMESTA